MYKNLFLQIYQLDMNVWVVVTLLWIRDHCNCILSTIRNVKLQTHKLMNVACVTNASVSDWICKNTLGDMALC